MSSVSNAVLNTLTLDVIYFNYHYYYFYLFLIVPITQIVKNLVFLAKTLQILDGESKLKVESRQDKTVARRLGINRTEEGPCYTLTALITNMNKLATLEASQTPKHTQKVSRLVKSLSIF